MNYNLTEDPSSFRDPEAVVLRTQDNCIRIINKTYFHEFNKLIDSGLYDNLIKKRFLISHDVIDSNEKFIAIKPTYVKYWTYPYEWTFEQLKAAALTTLKICKISLDYGMILKDASPYNIQFHNGECLLIDTTSFKSIESSNGWEGYMQFCMQFLYPLILSAELDLSGTLLLRVNYSGLDPKFTSKLLGWRKYKKIGYLLHVLIPASAASRLNNVQKKQIKSNLNNMQTLHFLLDNLSSIVENLNIDKHISQWKGYYDINNNYTDFAQSNKTKIVERIVKTLAPSLIVDLGSNDGKFSRLCSKYADHVVSVDYDLMATEKNYIESSVYKNITTVRMDITNPTPFVGLDLLERRSFFDRFYSDLTLALALIHHLYFTYNVSWKKLSSVLAMYTKSDLIVEFVDANDSQISKISGGRSSMLESYTRKNFEFEMLKRFDLVENIKIDQTCRYIYHWRKHD